MIGDGYPADFDFTTELLGPRYQAADALRIAHATLPGLLREAGLFATNQGSSSSPGLEHFSIVANCAFAHVLPSILPSRCALGRYCNLGQFTSGPCFVSSCGSRTSCGIETKPAAHFSLAVSATDVPATAVLATSKGPESSTSHASRTPAWPQAGPGLTGN
jgi:hypothetical protein